MMETVSSPEGSEEAIKKISRKEEKEEWRKRGREGGRKEGGRRVEWTTDIHMHTIHTYTLNTIKCTSTMNYGKILRYIKFIRHASIRPIVLVYSTGLEWRHEAAADCRLLAADTPTTVELSARNSPRHNGTSPASSAHA